MLFNIKTDIEERLFIAIENRHIIGLNLIGSGIGRTVIALFHLRRAVGIMHHKAYHLRSNLRRKYTARKFIEIKKASSAIMASDARS